MGALCYLPAWDVKRAKLFGRCEQRSGIVPFDRLVAQVMGEDPYRSAQRVFLIVDNGSAHRGKRAVARLAAKWPRWPELILVHLPVHASCSAAPDEVEPDRLHRTLFGRFGRNPLKHVLEIAHTQGRCSLNERLDPIGQPHLRAKSRKTRQPRRVSRLRTGFGQSGRIARDPGARVSTPPLQKRSAGLGSYEKVEEAAAVSAELRGRPDPKIAPSPKERVTGKPQVPPVPRQRRDEAEPWASSAWQCLSSASHARARDPA